ncbi:MAG TPA: hypothetical protein VEC99_17650 [Clostridia bacterium]|nr:hypothetical protein [Clostridia bacterium]
MAWFKKKTDPISDHERALSAEIAALEAEIKALDTQLQRQAEQPRLRSTALPQNAVLNQTSAVAAVSEAAAVGVEEPIFEDVYPDRLQSRAETPASPEHFNELGVRKYDFPALLRRIRNHFRGPSTTNPKLVSYLAAGGIQGLRPLRYEKRVARNRFMVSVVVLFLVLLGLVAAFFKR